MVIHYSNRIKNINNYMYCMKHDGRVVKALDLSSNGRMSAWVRTTLVLYLLLRTLD